MKLAQLFAPFRQFKLGQSADREVTGLTVDSRQVEAGQVYIALRGTRSDGHEFLSDVCAKDPCAVVVEDDSGIPADFRGAIAVVKDARQALFELAHDFYGRPTLELAFIGVTGTNGKTSTTYLVESVLNHFGRPTAVMGTIDHHFKQHSWRTNLTTPDTISLHRRLRDFLALGAQAVAMEVSSHAVSQDRVFGIPYDVLVFTNLTRDHLDYHGTMENYFAAKQKLFIDVPMPRPGRTVHAVINNNDPWGNKLQTASHVHRWTYGEGRSDFQFQILEMNFSHTRLRLQTPRGKTEISLPLIGRHNAYNAVAAMAAGMALGASLNTVSEGVESFTGVPGRLERLTTRDISVFVDYAHTDDALFSVLTTLHQVRELGRLKNKIITVFGCGGDRDRGKRPLMGRVAGELSDVVFVTSDNPRSESPVQIIADVIAGTAKSLMNRKVFVEVDRREAIRRALDLAGPGDVVLVAGKGHEDYQIIGEHKWDFSDVSVIKGILGVL